MLPLVFAADAAPATPQSADVVTAPPTPDAVPSSHRLRSGVVLGFTFGGGVGRGAGYPNDSDDIGAHTDYASSGWQPGTAGTILVMGALADYLNVGFWYARAGFNGEGHHASQSGIGLRVEAFPFVFVCPHLAGLALFSEFGLGSAKLTTTGVPTAEGTQSFIGTGAFYEWGLGHIFGGHFGLGPSLEYDAVFTQPYDQNGLVASLRAVWYGGP
jgi:hypothetical protein